MDLVLKGNGDFLFELGCYSAHDVDSLTLLEALTLLNRWKQGMDG